MENGIFAQQRKKSRTLVLVRLAAAALFILAGAGILLGQYLITESNVAVIDDDQRFYELDKGDYAAITTDQHYYTGYYFYTSDEDKPASYMYFIFTEDEIIVAESKGDFREDEAGQEREFRGVLQPLEDVDDYAESLAEYLDAFEITYDEDDPASYLPYHYLSVERPENSAPWAWGLLILGLVVLVLNLLALRAEGKLSKRMAAYGIDERAHARLEQELAGGDADEVGKLTLTKSFLYNKSTGAVSLFPLKEVVWVHQTVTQTRYYGVIPAGKTFTLQIYFSDGESIRLPGRKSVIEGAVELFARRCPQALIGFSPERQKAWSRDKDAIIRASRERAAELGADQDDRADEEDRYADTASYYDREE